MADLVSNPVNQIFLVKLSKQKKSSEIRIKFDNNLVWYENFVNTNVVYILNENLITVG